MIDPPNVMALHPRLEVDAETTTVFITIHSGEEYEHEMTVDHWEMIKEEQPPTYYCERCNIVGDDECRDPFERHHICPKCDNDMQWIICIFEHSLQ